MLVLDRACKTYRRGGADEVRALADVSMRVAASSFVVVVGTNGSGKSTLLGALAGAVELDSGRVELDGTDITRWGEHRRARLVGRVFQNPFAGTAPHLCVLENLALAARRGRWRGLGPLVGRGLLVEIRERVRTLGMGLEDRLDDEIGSLSGGQRQALTLLMATWVRPTLLLLDEHTAALDPRAADQVVRLTREVVERDRLTTLMVTHSLQQACSLGDRLLMMHRGEVVADIAGDAKRYLRADDLLQRFDELRRSDLLDASAAELLRATYV